MYYLDGKMYKKQSDIPDLGSLKGVDNEDGTRSYSGNNADASKLPTYVATGSDATLSDATGLYVYHFDGTSWNKA